MALEAINLDAVRLRVAALKSGSAQLFKSVGGVLEATQAMDIGARPPVAFVAVASEKPEPNRTQGVHDQKVPTVIAVLMCLPVERRDGAMKLTDAAEATRLAVIESLTGWTPPGARLAMDYAGYRVLNMAEGMAWLEASFSTSWTLRK